MEKHPGKKDTQQISFQKESIMNIQRYIDKEILIKFLGGREVIGIVKGSDIANNLILDECYEFIRDAKDPYIITEEKRMLGLVVGRGSMILSINPMDGTEEIANPFLNPEAE